jgi:hypothetical protein
MKIAQVARELDINERAAQRRCKSYVETGDMPFFFFKKN